MTDLRAAANMALNALEFSLPAIEDFGSKEQLTDCHRAIMELYKSLAQPDETETLRRCLFQMQEAAKALAQPEPQVCCGDYEKCMKACTPRGRWLAEKELTKPKQEPVCDKDPFYCWSIRCQVGKVCKHTAQPEPKSISTNDHLCAMLRQVHDVLACTALPMKRKWVGLTDEEIDAEMYARLESETFVKGVKWAEERLKEKNNAV